MEFLRDFTDADRGIWGTFLQLTIRPRRVVQSYLAGDRQRFIRPFRYLLFSISLSAVYLLFLKYWYDNPVEQLMTTVLEPWYADRLDAGLLAQQAAGSLSAQDLPVERTRNADLVQFLSTVVRYILQYLSVVFLVSIPLLASFNRFVFSQSSFNYAESLVATTYLVAQTTLLSFLVVPLLLLWHTMDALLILTGISTLGTVTFFIYATFAVYGARWWELPLTLVLLVCIVPLISVVSRSFGYVAGFPYFAYDSLELASYLRLAIRLVILGATGLLLYCLGKLEATKYLDLRNPVIWAGVLLFALILVLGKFVI